MAQPRDWNRLRNEKSLQLPKKPNQEISPRDAAEDVAVLDEFRRKKEAELARQSQPDERTGRSAIVVDKAEGKQLWIRQGDRRWLVKTPAK